MTRELGVQFARNGIRVNALCPGPVNTPLLRQLFTTDPEWAARRWRTSRSAVRRAGGDRQRRAFPRLRRSELHHRQHILVDGGISAAYVTPI
jgi:NAD(P)-dependent dehydrogenase (short-subunit alcohol dehydrogenase family)